MKREEINTNNYNKKLFAKLIEQNTIQVCLRFCLNLRRVPDCTLAARVQIIVKKKKGLRLIG
jgi:hypothetical protein